MSKNITEEYAKWMYAREKQPPKREYIKPMEGEKLEVFTMLCNLQRDGMIEEYRKLINWLKRWQ